MKAKMANKKTLQKLLDSMIPIEGEMRAVYKCGDCGAYFGRRFIPYGLGRGLSINLCMCQLTSNSRPSEAVLEATP